MPAAPASVAGKSLDTIHAVQMTPAPAASAMLVNDQAGGLWTVGPLTPATSLERCILLSRFVI
jgi:hypothetical protein